MNKWSDDKHIKERLRKEWSKGSILRQYIEDEQLFPYEIKLKTPNKTELLEKYNEVYDWSSQLRKKQKSQNNLGYRLVEEKCKYRDIGENYLPQHAIIDTVEDAISILKETSNVKLFCEVSFRLIAKWKCLKSWVYKNPIKVLNKVGKDCDKIISILQWFEVNPKPNCYIREISIKGVDTKFIENNKGILEELLLFVLKEEQVNLNVKSFEEKFNLKKKPILVRCRILDSKESILHFSDISVTIEEFEEWNPNIQKVFFTENEINFLSFPSVENACIIFGKGYGIEVFRNVKWLKNKDIFYWGDIDTHGFNILSITRGFLPNIQSFLMTESILVEHEEFWSVESKPYLARIQNLNGDELALVDKLQNNSFGKGIRLEQERINFSYVKEFLEGIDESY